MRELTMYQFLNQCLDWTSIKLTGLCTVMCFITPSSLLMTLTGIAACTTILLNAIKIYKELKAKK